MRSFIHKIRVRATASATFKFPSAFHIFWQDFFLFTDFFFSHFYFTLLLMMLPILSSALSNSLFLALSHFFAGFSCFSCAALWLKGLFFFGPHRAISIHYVYITSFSCDVKYCLSSSFLRNIF